MKTPARFLLIALVLQLGCSTTTTPATLQLPKSLNIASIAVAGQAEGWTPDHQVTIPLPCNPKAPLLVGISPQPLIDTSTNTSSIDNFTLTVPGDCGSLLSCGWLVLRALPPDEASFSVPAATSPITVSGITQPGIVTFQLELHDAGDSVLKDPNGNPFGDEVAVEFTDPWDCPLSEAADAGI